MRAVASRFNNYTLLAANDVDGSILCSSAGAVPGSYSNAAPGLSPPGDGVRAVLWRATLWWVR